jgi:hypothetical protein
MREHIQIDEKIIKFKNISIESALLLAKEIVENMNSKKPINKTIKIRKNVHNKQKSRKARNNKVKKVI